MVVIGFPMVAITPPPAHEVSVLRSGSASSWCSISIRVETLELKKQRNGQARDLEPALWNRPERNPEHELHCTDNNTVGIDDNLSHCYQTYLKKPSLKFDIPKLLI